MGYAFDADEYVVLTAQEVKQDGHEVLSAASELTLTNKKLIFERRSVFHKTKGFDVYPLSSIRIVDGRPQCRLDNSEFMETKLALDLTDGSVRFSFGSLEAKKEVRSFINEIYKLLVGHEAPTDVVGKKDVFERLDGVSERLDSVFDVMRLAFEAEAAADDQLIAWRCPSCNASLKGRKGETVTCPFCGSNVTIGLRPGDV